MQQMRLPGLTLSLTLLMCGILHSVSSDKLLDAETLKTLDACAEQHTSFLKGKISQQSINRFLDYYSKNLSKSTALPLVMISFTQSGETNSSSGWSINTTINSNNWPSYKLNRANNLVSWLKRNYTPKKDLKFFFLMEEPYTSGWTMNQKMQNDLSELAASCPMLVSCNHPQIPWTHNGVLIPDDYVLGGSFDGQMRQLLNSTTYASLDALDASGQKGLVPFATRKSKMFFSGLLTGPKRPFSFDTVTQNPRHNILTLLTHYPYLEVRINDFLDWAHQAPYSYLAYLKENFSHLKLSKVDFFEHAQRKYLLSFDGFGAAWSRPQLIMATGSVLLMNAQCQQYFYSLMENNKTHLTLNNDLSNLDELFQRLESNPDLAEKIGQNGRAFVQRFFTKPAIDAYLTAVLTKIESYTDSAQ